MKLANIQASLIDHMGSDLSVVNAARVSFDKESDWELVEEFDTDTGVDWKKKLSEKDVKLINYLAKHKHFSPFNHAFLSFRVKAPIFVARQLVKHKFLPWNEESRRYVDDEPEFYMPELRKRAENVKQGSSEEVVAEAPFGVFIELPVYVEDYIQIGLDMYGDALNKGIAPEVARAFLPQNMMTNWVWSGTLGAFLDMLVLRLDPHAQKESRIVAQAIAKHVQELFPVSFNARMLKYS